MDTVDLQVLDGILSQADAVVPMLDVHNGVTGDDVIGLRHDVDDNPYSLQTALKMARWEMDRGYRSTYFLLHTAHYWDSPDFGNTVVELAEYGHEIGIHANALTVALQEGRDPIVVLRESIERLRQWAPVFGVAGHGDRQCYKSKFVNDEIFTECPRPEMGAPDRTLHGQYDVTLEPTPLSYFGLEYETYRLPRGRCLSDSGGTWNIDPPEVASGEGQLHILQHPDWWAGAF